MIAAQRRRAQATAAAATSTRSPSLLPLLLLAAALHTGSSFLFPVTAVGRVPPSCKTWASSVLSQSATSSSDVGEPVSQPPEIDDDDAEEVSDEGDDQPKSPAGLTLEGVYKRLKLESLGLDDGTVQLDSKDNDYGVRSEELRRLLMFSSMMMRFRLFELVYDTRVLVYLIS